MTGIFRVHSVARIRELEICCALDLGLAPQALCFRLLSQAKIRARLCKAEIFSNSSRTGIRRDAIRNRSVKPQEQ
jgi:hypothetical protein